LNKSLLLSRLLIIPPYFSTHVALKFKKKKK
jgi:hypothetical protein